MQPPRHACVAVIVTMASAPGFQQATVSSVAVEVTKSYSINLQLPLGESHQTVAVNASAA